MPLDAPFRLGPFIVDTQGRLEPSDPGAFPTFHVVWRGCPVHARLDSAGGESAAQLALTAVVGRVPSTAGGDAAQIRERREGLFALLQGLERVTAEDWHVRLLPDHRVTIEASRAVAMPASAGDLVTQLTCFMLDLAPYLELLAEPGVAVEPVGGASRAGGTVNT